MQITAPNSEGNIGILLNAEEAKILYSLVCAGAQPGGTSSPRRFVRMIKNAFAHIGIYNHFNDNVSPENTWILHSHARIRDAEGNTIS